MAGAVGYKGLNERYNQQHPPQLSIIGRVRVFVFGKDGRCQFCLVKQGEASPLLGGKFFGMAIMNRIVFVNYAEYSMRNRARL
jgi:hypothetical protein